MNLQRSTKMLKSLIADVFPLGPLFHLARLGFGNPPPPIVLTFSVTAACQSRCKTCNIGKRYQEDRSIANDDLSLEEIEQIFRTISPVFFFNVSGGEPFLRADLPQIIRLACEHLHPGLIHIPTNGILPDQIARLTEELLENVATYGSSIPVTVKPSIDGVGQLHDEIRGVRGNFESLTQTITLLQELATKFENLHVDLGTVISKFNIEQLDKIEDFVHSLGVESYRNEIAEQRSEFHNMAESIGPDGEVYEQLMKGFVAKIEQGIASKKLTTRILEAMRVEYYHLAVRILEENRQVVPCLAGLTNVHLNYNGELWPCCVLGYENSLGNLRMHGLDFRRVFESPRASEVRRQIARGECVCTLANQAFSNIMYDPRSLLRVGLRALRYSWPIHRTGESAESSSER